MLHLSLLLFLAREPKLFVVFLARAPPLGRGYSLRIIHPGASFNFVILV